MRARSATSRALRSFRSTTSSPSVAPKEYDAIQAAAQLKVVWKSDPKFGAAVRQLLEVAADGRRHEHRQPAPLHRGHRRRSRSAGSGGEDRVGDVQVPLQRLHADRPACCGRRHQGHDSATVYVQGQSLTGTGRSTTAVRSSSRRCSTSRPRTIRMIWYEGSSSYGGGQQAEVDEQAALHLAEDRQAGASAVDALGPARLGHLRPVATCTT